MSGREITGIIIGVLLLLLLLMNAKDLYRYVKITLM